MTTIKFDNDIGIFQKHIGSELCVNLIDLFEKSEDSVTSYNDDIRVDFNKHFAWKQNNHLQVLKKELTFCLREYSKKYIGLNYYGLYNSTCKIQKTPIYGGFYNWHHEHMLKPGQESRVLVWMVYLNDLDYGDGTTEFLHQNLEYTPEQGTILIWPAYYNYVHRGNPPRKKIKYICTGWWEGVNVDHPFNDLRVDSPWISLDDYFL